MKHKRIFIFSFVIVAAFCVLGWFSRSSWPDDFMFHDLISEKGFIQAQISMYTDWAGRVFNTFLVCTALIFPVEEVQPFIASVTSLAYILACFSLAGTLLPSLSAGAKLSLSFLSCALTLCFTYSLNETFYWMLGGMTYFFTQSMMIFALSLAIKAFRGSRLSFIVCMIISFLNATILEQGCIFQGIAAFIAMILFTVRRNRRAAFIAGALWLVSVAGFCVMFFAPGTYVRMSGVNHQEQLFIRNILRGLIPAFSMGVMNGLQFLVKPLIYSVIFFLPSIAERISPADEKLSRRIRAWHIVLAMFAISIFMQYMVGVVTGGGGLAERGVSLSLWLMYFTWNILWVFFYRGDMIRSEGFRNFCAKFRWPFLILSVLVSANFIDCVKALRVAPEYAAEYDSRVELIASQVKDGVKYLTVPRLKAKPELIFFDIDAVSEGGCRIIAKYYGAENLHVIPSELAGDSEAVKKLMAGDLEPFAFLADNGDADAMRIIGLYRDPVRNAGRPDAWNIAEAEKYYAMGAEMGDPLCMRPLSKILLRKNFPLAVYWLAKSHLVRMRL